MADRARDGGTGHRQWAFRGLFIGGDRCAHPAVNQLSGAARDASALHALFTDDFGLRRDGDAGMATYDGVVDLAERIGSGDQQFAPRVLRAHRADPRAGGADVHPAALQARVGA